MGLYIFMICINTWFETSCRQQSPPIELSECRQLVEIGAAKDGVTFYCQRTREELK